MTILPKSQIKRFASDTDLDTLSNAIDDDGVVIIRSVLSLDVIQRLQNEVESSDQPVWLEDNLSLKDSKFPTQARHANNLVPASKTYRDDVLNNSAVHATCNAVFRDVGDYWLTTGILRTTKPGSPAQGFHRDALLYPVLQYQPATSPPLTVALLVSMTDATVANGATRVILGSHKWEAVGTPSEDQAVRAELNAGDMLVIHQRLVHAGGEHTHQAPDTRRMLLMFFTSCQLVALESPLALSREMVETMTPLAQKMVGWRTVRPVEPNTVGLNTHRSGCLEDGLKLKAAKPLQGQEAD
jgi:verruculogen synthase